MDPIWNRIHREMPWGRYPSEDVVRVVMRKHGNLPPHERSRVRILDLGSGGGANTWMLDREGFDWYGIDGSPDAARKTEESTFSGLKKRAFQADFCESLPFEDATFDGIIDNFAIYSNPKDAQKRAIVEILRVLKPGGWLYSAHFTPETSGSTSGKVDVLDPLGREVVTVGPLVDRGYVRWANRESLDDLLHGFRSVEFRYADRGLFGCAYQVCTIHALAIKGAA